MSLVKSFAIGNGDMYYIRHNSDNFTVVDCSLPDDRRGSILAEITTQAKNKGIHRFVSTHPDQDHISGLVELDDAHGIVNFYCVKNNASKDQPTDDFKRYCELRDDPKKAFYIYRNCSRRWMNSSDDERKTSGIEVLWPITDDPDFQSAQDDAAQGMTPNNLSCIIRYGVTDGPSFMWMGDLETDFMEKIQKKIQLPRTDVLFAPHHGRDSGKVPPKWLGEIDPALIVIGEAPSEYLNYYAGYDIITQNSCGDILFDCVSGAAHVYVADNAYQADCLDDEGLDHRDGLYYLGSLQSR